MDGASPVPTPRRGAIGLVVSNLVALVHAAGFKFVRRKPRGSVNVSRALVRVSRTEPAARTLLMPPDPSRYLTVQVQARPGINHLRFALELLVREAVSVGRMPVAFKPRFDPRHNRDHDIDVDWDRYIDLDRVELVEAETGVLTVIRVLRGVELDSIESLAALWIERDHVLTARECHDFDLIVRHNRTGLHVPAVHDGAAGLPKYLVRFHPSVRVERLAQAVRQRLADYCGVHVRRDDMLEMKDLYPNLDRDTQPDRIGDTLARVVAEGSAVYILTNERDKTFFTSLKKRFRVFQYFDFPELSELVEGPEPDNFLLFEVEKLLFEGAKLKVHTFTHPEGGKRISLTSDKGWA